MEYAPVIIPTLNRDKHLKRCLDSLAANSVAKYTDIYISLDYPPSDKYVAGYERVKKLLEEYDFSGFKSHTILYQQSNLGAAANSVLLEDTVRGFTDTVIYTEDDNEFSPNFLEYIDKGFEEFKDDDTVLYLCGSSDSRWLFSESSNVIKSKVLAAYGVGYWLSRKKKNSIEGNDWILCRKNWTFRNFRDLYKKNRVLFWIYVSGILSTDKGLYWENGERVHFCDTSTSIYMHYSDKVCVCPTIAKSHTFGNDGSGVNMPAMDNNAKTDLDTACTFDYVYDGDFRFDERNYKIGDSIMFSEISALTPIRFRLFISWMIAIYICVTKSRRLPVFLHRLFSKK